MIRFEHVSKWLLQRRILDDVSFEVGRGEILVIVGPSGAGKSVTLKHMICLLRPDQGRVIVGDDVISEAPESELDELRKRFGMLFQSSALLEWLSITENIALPLREKSDMTDDEIIRRTREKLALVGLEDDGNKHPSELSGGMRKRAGLARALIENPEIVLYDEPTAGLDPVSARSIDALINRLRKELSVTSVVVTHDLHSALGIGTHIAMIYEGRILEVSTPQAFIQSDEEVIKDFLKSQFITKSGPWERQL